MADGCLSWLILRYYQITNDYEDLSHFSRSLPNPPCNVRDINI